MGAVVQVEVLNAAAGNVTSHETVQYTHPVRTASQTVALSFAVICVKSDQSDDITHGDRRSFYFPVFVFRRNEDLKGCDCGFICLLWCSFLPRIRLNNLRDRP